MYSPDWKPVVRAGVHQPRPTGTRTPCHSCPKVSPENAKQLELTPANMATLRLYLRSRATHGACLTEAERLDARLLKNFAIVDIIFRRWERDQQTTGFLDVIALMKGAK